MSDAYAEVVEAVFAGARTNRVLGIERNDDLMYIRVRVDHSGPVRLSELMHLARALGVHETRVEVWDTSPNEVTVMLDMQPDTNPGYVHAMLLCPTCKRPSEP